MPTKTIEEAWDAAQRLPPAPAVIDETWRLFGADEISEGTIAMRTEQECRKEFEALCRFMRVEFSLEWDNAGFYQQLETDRSYTWFKLGFDRTKTSQIDTLVASAKNRIAHTY